MPAWKTALRSRISRCMRACAGIAFATAAVLLIGAAVPAHAEHTRFWRQSTFENFERGTAKGTAVSSNGKITLAPKFTQLADTSMAYVWDLRLDSKGNLYAAGGSNAKVVKIDPAGKTTTVFDSTELSAQALAIDRRDNVYVATSPDGKIYKITPDGQKSVFFDPQAKYIWSLTISPEGTLYAGTGEDGKIFSISPDGKGEVFYTGSETHIRALALDGKSNLLAGTDPNGLVLRIPLAAPAQPAAARGGATTPATATRQAYVVYETSRREITSLLLDAQGNLFVGAIGEKARTTSGGAGQPTTIPINPTAGTPGPAPAQQAPPLNLFQPFPTVTSAAVYRIAPDGSPQELWTSREDIVYALGTASDGKVVLGTGNQGLIVQLDMNRVFSELTKTTTGQVTAFARGAGGKTYVATANPGKIFTLGPEMETDATFESQPFDARIFSRWGRVTWWGESAGSAPGSIELYVRAGNTSDPENNWSTWAGPYRDARGEDIQAPAARFIQWKAVLHSERGTQPELSWVNLAYLPKNVAPDINAIAVQSPGIRATAPGGGGQGGGAVPLQQPTAAAALNAQARQQTTDSAPAAQRNEPQAQGFTQRGQQAVLWTADDDNDDDLTYSVYYRGEGEKDWKLLRDKLTQRFYSWDTTSMADGAYYLKVVASDERSNAPGTALTAERESDRFVVDNTPPAIADIAAEPLAGTSGVTLRFRATDATSAIVTTQYSVDAGDWTLALPSSGISDATDEPYAIPLRDLKQGEHTVAVRAYDQFENVGAGKVTFTIPAARR